MKDRPFLISGILGLGAVIMTFLMSAVGPRPAAPLPDGFITPVLAFEFAESEAELDWLSAPPAAPGSAVRAGMDRLNRLDFLYIALYGGCLLAFALTAAQLTGRRLFLLAAAVAAGIMLADVLENVQLLTITRLLGEQSVAPQLALLQLFTWLKWGGLALWFVLLWPFFRGRRGLGRVIELVAFGPALLAIIAFLLPGLASELFALVIGLMFLLLTAFSWRFRQPAAVLVAT